MIREVHWISDGCVPPLDKMISLEILKSKLATVNAEFFIDLMSQNMKDVRYFSVAWLETYLLSCLKFTFLSTSNLSSCIHKNLRKKTCKYRWWLANTEKTQTPLICSCHGEILILSWNQELSVSDSDACQFFIKAWAIWEGNLMISTIFGKLSISVSVDL